MRDSSPGASALRRPSQGPRENPEPPQPAVIVVVAGLALWSLYMLRHVLTPFVLAAIVAYVCTRPIDRLAMWTRLPRASCAAAVLLLLAGCAGLVGYFGLPPLLRDLGHVANDLEGSLQAVAHALLGDREIDLLGTQFTAATLGSGLAGGLNRWLSDHTWLIAAWVVAGFFGLILFWVLLGYFLVDGRRVARSLARLLPPASRPFAQRVWGELDPLLLRYFVGVGVVVVYAAGAAYLGLGLILGLRHAIALALLTGVLELVPVVGPVASALIAGLVAIDHAAGAADIVSYVLYAIALRVSIDQLFGPLVLGRAVRVPPALIIFCFLAGAALLGIVGVIVAVPAALAVKLVLAKLYGEPHTDHG
jgi:predicted PurR-regulated permease PerM